MWNSEYLCILDLLHTTTQATGAFILATIDAFSSNRSRTTTNLFTTWGRLVNRLLLQVLSILAHNICHIFHLTTMIICRELTPPYRNSCMRHTLNLDWLHIKEKVSSVITISTHIFLSFIFHYMLRCFYLTEKTHTQAFSAQRLLFCMQGCKMSKTE
jgi:hypothetical protein